MPGVVVAGVAIFLALRLVQPAYWRSLVTWIDHFGGSRALAAAFGAAVCATAIAATALTVRRWHAAGTPGRIALGSSTAVLALLSLGLVPIGRTWDRIHQRTLDAVGDERAADLVHVATLGLALTLVILAGAIAFVRAGHRRTATSPSRAQGHKRL